MKTARAGDLAALTCALACGLGNIPSKAGLRNLTPELFNFYFFLFAWLLSSMSLLNARCREEIRHTSSRTFGLIFLLAVLFAVALTLQMTALKMIEPATASFLSRFEVILTIVFAYFILRERLGILEIIGGTIALAGVFILRFEASLAVSRGATLMLLSALFFAVSEIIIKRNIASIATVSLLFYRNLFLIPISYGILHFRGQRLSLPVRNDLFLIFAASLLLPVIGRATYQIALKRIDLSRAALITQTTPLFTALFAFLILVTAPTAIEWLGGGLIIFGVTAVNLSHRAARFISYGKPNPLKVK